MTSNPTTPISIRRNNFLLNCENDVTGATSTTKCNTSRIPLPSPGSFRRSASLRLRGSKSCLSSPTTISTSLKMTPSSQQFFNNIGEKINKTTLIPNTEQSLSCSTSPSSSSLSSVNNVRNKTPTTIMSTKISSPSSNTKICPSSLITTTTNMLIRPNNTKITDENTTTTSDTSDNSAVVIDTSFEVTSIHTSVEQNNCKKINSFVKNIKDFDINNKLIKTAEQQQDNTATTTNLNVATDDSHHHQHHHEQNGSPSAAQSTAIIEQKIIEPSSLLKKNMENNICNFFSSEIIKNNNNNNNNSSSPLSPSQQQQAISSSCLNNDKKIPSGNGKRDPNGMSLNLNGPTTSATSSSTTIVKTPKTPHTPRTPSSSSSSIPGPLHKATPKTPPVTPDSPHIYLDDDLESIYSYSSVTSGRSTMSCEHPYVARNGTTFSGRKMKYVVHCSAYAGQVGEDYLTPTQRAQRQLRRLKELLTQARQDLEQKDSEILRLTREVVELRLFKASLSSPEDRSNSSDAVTVREATTDLKTSQDVSPIVDMVDDGTHNKSSPRHILHNHHHGLNQVQFLEKMSSCEMQSSFADSGHFEDMTTSSVHSKDSYIHTQDRACGSDTDVASSIEEQRQELINMYEKRIEELIKNQDTTTTEIKRTHNDKVEALLQKLAECNSRYADLVPDYEQAKERIRELEKQLEDLQRKLQEQDETQKKLYLHMYTKEQEAERLAQADQMLELAHPPSNRVSITELLKQLQSTQDELENIRASNCRSQYGNSQVLLTAKEAISLWVLGARKTIYRRLLEAQENKTKVDPEVTLQFLKSAIYYFLTDKENSQGHLKAIESILEFSEQEKQNISKARSSK